MTPSRIPAIYRPATFRVVTPSEAGYVGVGFDLEDGQTVRLKISVSSLHKLAELSRSHSLGSSGIPSADVSSNLPVEG